MLARNSSDRQVRHHASHQTSGTQVTDRPSQFEFDPCARGYRLQLCACASTQQIKHYLKLSCSATAAHTFLNEPPTNDDDSATEHHHSHSRPNRWLLLVLDPSIMHSFASRLHSVPYCTTNVEAEPIWLKHLMAWCLSQLCTSCKDT